MVIHCFIAFHAIRLITVANPDLEVLLFYGVFGGFDPKISWPPLDPPMDRLQKIMNEGALIVYHILRFCHITSALANLHWLPVQLRIHFKIALLVFKTLHGLAPSYSARTDPPKDARSLLCTDRRTKSQTQKNFRIFVNYILKRPSRF